MVESLKNIGNYYRENLSEKANFEALKVIPTLISILGKDFPENQNSLWISIGIFFDILTGIEVEKIKAISQSEIATLLKFFKDNCVIYGTKGIADGAFTTVFPDIRRQDALLSLFITVSGDHKPIVLATYLIYSAVKCKYQGQPELVYQMIQRNQYAFGQQVFSQLCAELLHHLMTKAPHDPKLNLIVLNIFQFAARRKLLSKSAILLMKTALLGEKSSK